MNRKLIFEKQRALGNISQSKTGDAILRKNIFEMRVLKTKLNDLENEQKVWKTHHNYGVKEAEKEAREMAETAKVVTFRRVAKVALATQRLKNLAPLLEKTHRPSEGLKEVIEDVETNTQYNETSNKEFKPFPRKVRQPNLGNSSRLPPLTLSQPRHSSSHFSEKSSNFPSPLLIRRRVDTWTGRSVISADSSSVARDVTHFSGPRTETMSPMLDKRFLGLKAALVPLHPSEESEDEEEQQEKEEDSSSDDEITTYSNALL